MLNTANTDFDCKATLLAGSYIA